MGQRTSSENGRFSHHLLERAPYPIGNISIDSGNEGEMES